jgi:hypothetical protein
LFVIRLLRPHQRQPECNLSTPAGEKWGTACAQYITYHSVVRCSRFGWRQPILECRTCDNLMLSECHVLVCMASSDHALLKKLEIITRYIEVKLSEL